MGVPCVWTSPPPGLPLLDIGRCVLPFFLGFFVWSWMISFLWLSNLEKSKQRKGSVNGAEMVIAMADKMR